MIPVRVTVNLDRPIPERFVGKMCLIWSCSRTLFGKPWIMDDKHGIFPEQPNGPVLTLPPNYLHTGDLEPDARADIKHLSGDNQGI